MSWVKTTLLFGLFLCVLLSVPRVRAAAEEYRQCTIGESCQIGEYLFDDSYAPVTTATCTLNGKDPANASFFTNQSMTSQSDGWYSHSFSTTGEDLGMYRTTMCCLHDGETVCTDKTFEIVTSPSGITSSEVTAAVWDTTRASHATAGTFGENLQNPSSLSAADVWAYPSRSLTSFGTLVADIWGYSSRSLNSVSSLVSSIWSHGDRTITDADLDDGSLATKGDVESIEDDATSTVNNVSTQVTDISNQVTNVSTQISELSEEVAQQTVTVEKLINPPIIETIIEDGTPPPLDLQAKIQKTKDISQLLVQDTSRLQKQIASLNTNWETVNYQLALAELSTSSRVLGATTDPDAAANPDTVATQIAWLEKQWNSPIVTNLSTQATSALNNTNSISREVKSYGKTVLSKEYLAITNEHLTKLSQVIGTEGTTNQDTLFGYIAELEQKDQAITTTTAEIEELQKNWLTYPVPVRDAKLARLKKTVLAFNTLPGVELLLEQRKDDEYSQQNQALALKGIVDSNYTLLVQEADQVVNQTWLEHGSVIFRSLVSNPSSSISQTVPIKYVLPPEVKAEDIIKKDDSITVSYNQEKNALVAAGEITLEPNETASFTIEVKDVWVIPQDEIDSMRKQTASLFEPLKNTSYFAQGSTIKADIEVNLDKVELLQKNTVTPEGKIRAYREAVIEFNAAKAKMEDLKVLVSSAGSIGTVFGFVGGVQTLAVWGLIVILVAGFVFLGLYMKVLARPTKTAPPTKEVKKTIPSLDSPKNNMSLFGLLKEIVTLSSQHALSPGKAKSKFVITGIGIFLVSVMGILGFIIFNAQAEEIVSPVGTIVTTGHPTEITATTPTLEQTSTPLTFKTKSVTAAPASPSTQLANAPTLTPTKTPLKTVYVTVNQDEAITIRKAPAPSAEVVSRIWITKKAQLLDQVGDWVEVKLEGVDASTSIQGWIQQNYISANGTADE